MIRNPIKHFQKQVSHAESNLEQRFLRSREKSEFQSNRQDLKLYLKVLTIAPFNRIFNIRM